MAIELTSVRSAPRRASALSYGPFGYAAPAIVGFLAGGVAFLVADTMLSTPAGELPLLLVCSGGGTVLMLVATMIANWRIGSRIREHVEFQRTAFAGGKLPQMQPRPDVPGIMLEPAAAYTRAGKAKVHQN